MPEPPEQQPVAPDFDAIYRRWFADVWRWLRSLQGMHADLEDLAQEVFIVVERKLPSFDGRFLGSWLYRIAARVASDHRRRAWFRNLVLRRSDANLDALSHPGASPACLLEEREQRRELWHLLSKIREPRRTTFVLFELEGYSGLEIAALQEIPIGTVWTRINAARRDFMTLAERARLRRKD